MNITTWGAAVVLFVAGTTSAIAAPLTEGNLVFQSRGTIYEYTQSGQVVQTFSIPAPVPDWRSTEYARDIVVLNRSYILVYNGTFDPYLSILDINTNTWTHRKDPGLWTINNSSYGGIAANEDYAFLSDMGPDYNNPEGVVRFDLDSMASVEIEVGEGVIDVNLGLDGKLYALFPGGSPGGRYVKVYNPEKLTHIGDVSLADIFGHTAHRAIAVNEIGEMFIADWDGDIQKIDQAGNVTAQTSICGLGYSCSLYDVDVAEDGTVISSSRSGDVFIMDSDLQNIRYFRAASSGGFVSFVGYSLIPIKILLDQALNFEGCVEATDPDGALLSFSLMNSNPEVVTYSWMTSTGVNGSESTFEAPVAVNETVKIAASITEPLSGNTQDTEIGVCVSDTTPPVIEILSPLPGELIKSGKIDLDVSIVDTVDPDISSYEVFLGRALEMSYPGDSRKFNINLSRSTSKGDEIVDITVFAEDYSGNRSEASVQVELRAKPSPPKK